MKRRRNPIALPPVITKHMVKSYVEMQRNTRGQIPYTYIDAHREGPAGEGGQWIVDVELAPFIGGGEDILIPSDYDIWYMLSTGKSPYGGRSNPLKDGISSDTIVIFGVGTALIGALIYAVYTISDQLSASTAQIGQAAGGAQSVADQIAAAQASAQDVANQIYAANQTVQTAQQSPAAQAANQAAAWWNQ